MQGSIRPPRLRLPLLFALALLLGAFDGADIASIGQTLSRIIRTFNLDPAGAGVVASASMLGLAIGAAAGGRLADLYGWRRVVACATLLVAAGSLGTAAAWDYPTLIAVRFGAGLGIGALMAVLIEVAGEAANKEFRATALGLLMAAGPIGGIVVGFVALLPDWRSVFYFGGLGPLLLLPAVVLWFPQRGPSVRPAPRVAGAPPIGGVLFGAGRAGTTILIWTIAFITTLVSYIFLNWLPVLLVKQGASEATSHFALIVYSLGGVPGNILAGLAMDRRLPRLTYSIGYLGGSLCIAGLALGAAGEGLLALAFATDLCILGAQLVTFAIAPNVYPQAGRATGLGAMVCAGRLGSVVGPSLVGLALHAGLSPRQVLLAVVPAFVLAWLLGLWLARRAPLAVDGAVAVEVTGAYPVNLGAESTLAS